MRLAGRAAPKEVDKLCRSGDVPAHYAKRGAQRPVDRGQPMYGAVAFGNPAAGRAEYPNSVVLVEICHRAASLCDTANLCDRRDPSIHRID
jgi:hypothetical protein